MGDGIAHTQARQTIGLGEGARHDQVGKSSQVCQAIRVIAGLQLASIFEIGLIQHHNDTFRNLLKEVFQFGLIEPGAGWIIRISQKDQFRFIADGNAHSLQIVPPLFCRGNHRLCPNRLGHQGINRKGML